jgi:hypothetical protein
MTRCRRRPPLPAKVGDRVVDQLAGPGAFDVSDL